MRLEFEQSVSMMPPVERGMEANGETAVSTDANDALLKGIAAAQSGNRSQARILLQYAVQVDSASEAGWLWLASISEYPEELLVFLDRVLEINPENARALEWKNATKLLLAKTFVQRGIDASKEGRNDYAMQCFDTAISHDEQNQLAWFWKTSLSEQEAKASNPAEDEPVVHCDAPSEFRSSLTKEQSIAAMFRAAKSALVSGDRARALRLIDDIIVEDPDSEKAWTLRSHIAEDPEEKRRSFEKVLQINPDNITAKAALDSLLALEETVAPDTQEDNSSNSDSSRFISIPAIPVEADFVHENIPTQELELPESMANNNPFLSKNDGEFSHDSDAGEEIGSASLDEDFPSDESKLTSDVESYFQPDGWKGYEHEEQELQNASSNGSSQWHPFTIPSLDESEVQEVSAAVSMEETDELSVADSYETPEVESFNAYDAEKPAIEIDEAELSSFEKSEENQDVLELNEPSARTILVVDDSATVRKLIAGKLEGAGYRVVAAANGKEAISAISGFCPDLVLLDIAMPKMDGYQVCERIRKNESTKDVPVVMISGKDGYFDEERGERAGTTSFISKPFGPETLMKALGSYLPPVETENGQA